MAGGIASSTVPTGTNSTTSRKGHNRRESTGHVCTACDQCYRCKVRCSGEKPVCERCRSQNSACTYSTGKPLGKPKGSKNKVQRSKSSSDVVPKKPLAPADIAIKPDWNHVSPTKRSNDGELPPPKRSNFDFSGSEAFPQLSVTSNIPDAATLAPVVLQPEPSSLASEPIPSFVDTTTHDVKAPFEHRDGPKVDEGFPSAELNLEIDDFDWFTLVGGTPAAAPVELSTHDNVSTIPAVPAIQPPSSAATSQSETNESIVSVEKPEGPLLILTPIPLRRQHESLGCLCDPLSLGIISELHNLQLSFSPLDTALILARRGLTTVSSYLSCPSCLSHLSNSPSLFLACVLILQQVFACYLTVRFQGTKMLTDVQEKEKGHSSVSIGDFEVEGEEGCNGVLDAIVKAEMEKGRGIIGGLENCVEKAGAPGKERVAGVLLRALREEIGWGTAAC